MYSLRDTNNNNNNIMDKCKSERAERPSNTSPGQVKSSNYTKATIGEALGAELRHTHPIIIVLPVLGR